MKRAGFSCVRCSQKPGDVCPYPSIPHPPTYPTPPYPLYINPHKLLAHHNSLLPVQLRLCHLHHALPELCTFPSSTCNDIIKLSVAVLPVDCVVPPMGSVQR